MSPLDLPLPVTMFPNLSGKKATKETISLRAMVPRIQSTMAAEKRALPLIKLATFGDTRTGNGSLRHDKNITSITGIEGDYDGGLVSLESAAQSLRDAGITAMIYGTPSDKPDAPRWRVFCPLSEPLPPDRRDGLCRRLNGALGGVLAPESFTLSQAYYFGRIDNTPTRRVEMIEGGPIDFAGHLDVGAIDKPPTAGTKLEQVSHGGPAPIPLTSSLGLAADPFDIAAALGVIPNDGPAGWVAWNETAMAVWAATGGSAMGYAALDAWSARNSSYDPKETQGRWDRFKTSPPEVIGAGTIFHMAREACPGWKKPSDMRTSATRFHAGGGLQLVTPLQCSNSPRRGYVVKNLIAPGDLGIVFGAPGTGKSILSPHIGYAVAQGRPVFGRRTRQGDVLYIPAEDPHGMRQRIAALRMAHGDAPGFAMVDGVSDLFSAGSMEAAELVATVEARRPALVFIDTLAAAAPGLRENESEDMGRVIAFARAITRLGPAVILIHHAPKGDDSTPRGHGALNGAADVTMRLSRDGTVIQATAMKNRNGPCDASLVFSIRNKELGTDEDDDPITAPIASEAIGVASRKAGPKLSPRDRAARSILERMLLAGPDRVPMEDWTTECCTGVIVSNAARPKDRRDSVRTTIQSLVRKGVVCEGAGMVWLPKEEGFDAFPAWAAEIDPSLHSLMQ